jgi:hypothetical protein
MSLSSPAPSVCVVTGPMGTMACAGFCPTGSKSNAQFSGRAGKSKLVVGVKPVLTPWFAPRAPVGEPTVDMAQDEPPHRAINIKAASAPLREIGPRTAAIPSVPSGNTNCSCVAARRADETGVERAAVRVGGARERADLSERRTTAIGSSINENCVGEALEAGAAVAVDTARDPLLAGGPRTAGSEESNCHNEGTEQVLEHRDAQNTYLTWPGSSV